jgi:hypothetical protein
MLTLRQIIWMASLEESAAALRAAGFGDVQIRDRHAWYLPLAQRELKSMEGALGLNSQARACNFVWNFCNDTQLQALKWNKRSIGARPRAR